MREMLQRLVSDWGETEIGWTVGSQKREVSGVFERGLLSVITDPQKSVLVHTEFELYGNLFLLPRWSSLFVADSQWCIRQIDRLICQSLNFINKI